MIEGIPLRLLRRLLWWLREEMAVSEGMGWMNKWIDHPRRVLPLVQNNSDTFIRKYLVEPRVVDLHQRRQLPP